MIREAGAIFDRFLATNAPDWVCVDQKMVDNLQASLNEAKTNPIKMNRQIFNTAQHYVYKNLEHDLLPRFIKAALAPSLTASSPRSSNLEGTGSKESKESLVEMDDDNGPRSLMVDGKFAPDEVLRHHLLQLQKKPDGLVTSLMGTANAYRSLFPSPRYAIEGRKGSGLAPDALTSFNEDSSKIIASTSHETSEKLNSSRMQNLLLSALPRPLSIRGSVTMNNGGAASNTKKKGTGTNNTLLAQASSSLDTTATAKEPVRRNSTGNNKRKDSKSDLLAELKLEEDVSFDFIHIYIYIETKIQIFYQKKKKKKMKKRTWEDWNNLRESQSSFDSLLCLLPINNMLIHS